MHSPHKGRTGWRRAWNATRYSLAGLGSAARHEAAFRELVLMVLVLAPAGLWLGENGTERALLLGSLCLPLVAEMLNAAIEALVDRISLEEHPLAKRAKDMGSAAVMLALAGAGVVWLLVLL
ncbi:MAG TPA: diacylglycerol kinase [Burkholderiales bacterium]|nr:diacylglycerol kinase [Burkholderiales bacterium]